MKFSSTFQAEGIPFEHDRPIWGRNRFNPCPAILVPARRGSLREQSSDKRHRISLAWRGTSRHALPKAEGEDHLRVPSRVGIGAAEQSERFTEMWPKVIANKSRGVCAPSQPIWAGKRSLLSGMSAFSKPQPTRHNHVAQRLCTLGDVVTSPLFRLHLQSGAAIPQILAVDDHSLRP